MPKLYNICLSTGASDLVSNPGYVVYDVNLY